MAQLIVRDLEEDLVRKLRVRAARPGKSAEAEHREILRHAFGPRAAGKTLKQRLLEIPLVGDDEDFRRPRDIGRRTRL
ncbi:MAG TPA: DNA-binding protein [Thermoanaerobaculia bacterium]|nr:DNA-binding protein [Thermoanaerobaculia bacterium]